MAERGEQAIAVPVQELRRLCFLPDEVDIVAVLPSLTRDAPIEWQGAGFEPLIYLRIRSQYAFHLPPRAILIIETLDDFLERYALLRQGATKAAQVASRVKQLSGNSPGFEVPASQPRNNHGDSG